MNRSISLTLGSWTSVVERLDPNRDVVIGRSRQKEVVLFGADDTEFRIGRGDVRRLFERGKLPIWLVAKLLETGALGGWRGRPSIAGRG